MTAFLVWGGGGHGRVVADIVRAAGHRMVGFIDRDPAKLGRVEGGSGDRVVMLESEFLAAIESNPSRIPDGHSIALGIGDNRQRLAKLELFDHAFAPPLIHPSAIVSSSARLGPGTVVFPGAIINADARLEAAVIVNTAAVVEHDCWIGEGAHLAPGSILTGGVRVGRLSLIGAGAAAIPGVSIGAEARVGAGAVVIRDVEDGTTVAGVPAKLIQFRSTEAPSDEA